MSLKSILAQEGLISSNLPKALLDFLTDGGRRNILSQDGGKILTDGGGDFKTGAKFAAYKFTSLEKAAEDIERAKAEGNRRRYIPIMKAFSSKKEALAWLSSY